MSSDAVTIESPDKRKRTILEYIGEARFGPAFFLGSSSGFDWPLGETPVGEDAHWSANSRFVVVLMFRSQDTATSPDVELVAIDTEEQKIISIDRNAHGLIYQCGFVDSGDYEYRFMDHGKATTRRWRPPSP